MSDTGPTFDGGVAEPVPEFQVPGEAGEAPQSAEAPEAPREFLEVDDEVGGMYVRVKVDGEDIEVPLSEALSGYSRTSDYTRKTQELAAQRQETEFARTLQRALETNPQETLNLLARQYGIEYADRVAAQQGIEPVADDDDDVYVDPLERELRATRSLVEQMAQERAQERADQQLQRAVSGLQQRYSVGEDVVRQVVGTAYQMGVGPEAFDMIYQSLAYQQTQARTQAETQAAAARQAQDQVRQAAAGQVTNAMTASGGTPPTNLTGPPQEALTIREAFEQAWEQHVGPDR